MNKQQIVKELERILSVLNGANDVITASPFAKEHYEELIDDLCDKIQLFRSKILKDELNDSTDFKNLFDKYNKVRGLILNLDINLTNSKISLPYNISKDFNEIVKLVKN